MKEIKFNPQQAEAISHRGYRYGEIAILARLYRLMPLIEATMIKEGIPYSSLSGFLYDRQDMKTAVAAIQYLLKGGQGEGLDCNSLNRITKDLCGSGGADREKDLPGCIGIPRYPASGP
jgi:superfamily I DNA/RNA helicase